MIQLAGATNMTARERKRWHSYLKAELKKLVRDREPLEYIVVLPATPNLMEKEYPAQYAVAYQNGDVVPIKVPVALHADVMIFDRTYACRGCTAKGGEAPDLTASIEALARLAGFRQQEAREPTLPGWKVFGSGQPSGKPMRSLANL